MGDKKDDPREVLSLLNSLGFVGITAQQLKAFMKDLKMHRKIKERERQEWKDETKRKILLRQQELYREVLSEHKMETMGLNSVTESTISSESSTFQDDSSYKVVTVKIRCVPKDKENEPEDNANSSKTRKANSAKTHTSWAEELRQNSLRYEDNGYNTSSSTSINESHRRYAPSNNYSQNHSAGASTDSTKYISLEKPKSRNTRSDKNLKQSNLDPPKSPVRLKSSSSRSAAERTEHSKHSQSTADAPANPPPSRSSVHSNTKSFIRPWRLQPDMHRSSKNVKSDPVALYQKYRDEWKQLALPGEENHAGIRWAVREKMLGIDPNPRLDISCTIDGMSRDCTNSLCDPLSISDRKERKMYRRKSRKIRKLFSSVNSIERCSKTAAIAVGERYTYFKSISESFLAQSTSFELHKIEKASSPRSIATLATNEFCGIKIEHDFVMAESRETCSRVTSTKQTLGRLVRKLLEKDIDSYTRSYKYMDKCCCRVSRTEYL